MMNDKKINRIKGEIENLFAGEKSKGFAVHLIQSFGNLNTIHKVNTEEDLKEGSKCRCSLCNKKLSTVQELLNAARFLPVDEVSTEIKENIQKDELNTLPEIKDFKGMKQAFISVKSNRVLCEDCISALSLFIAEELAKENAEMITITTPKKRVKKQVVKSSNQVEKFNQKKQAPKHGGKKARPHKPNPGLQALSDNEALLALKQQLEGNE